jgi:hypothetical protein
MRALPCTTSIDLRGCIDGSASGCWPALLLLPGSLQATQRHGRIKQDEQEEQGYQLLCNMVCTACMPILCATTQTTCTHGIHDCIGSPQPSALVAYAPALLQGFISYRQLCVAISIQLTHSKINKHFRSFYATALLQIINCFCVANSNHSPPADPLKDEPPL